MEKTFRDMMLACTFEIVCLPILAYVYTPNGIVFWLLLMARDSYIVRHMPFFELLKIGMEEHYKKERNQLLFMQFAYFVGLGIIAFTSLPLAGVLLLNDIIVDFLCFIMAMNDKKNK